MISLHHLVCLYGNAKKISFPDWEVAQGEHCLVLGASGSGKTTLLHIVAGLRSYSQGEVMVAGVKPASLKGSRLDTFRGRNIGLVFQKPHLLAALTVEDNLLLAQYMARLPQDKTRIAEALDALQLGGKQKARVHELSQGEAQRVGIARAVLNKPRVLLADEPTASLDDDNCERVMDLLVQQANRHGATLMIATHDQRVKSRFLKQLILTQA